MVAYAAYLAVVFVVAVLFYTIVRLIDFGFTKLEDERRYDMVQTGIDYTMRSAKRMSLEVTKEINRELFKMSGEDDEL